MADEKPPLPPSFATFEEKYSVELEKADRFFAKNVSMASAQEIKLKNYQARIKKVGKGEVVYGFSLSIKDLARKSAKKEGTAEKRGFPKGWGGREMTILALASFTYMDYAYKAKRKGEKKKMDMQVDNFLKAVGPFDLDMSTAVIREVYPEVAAIDISLIPA
jgi:hypothetical protein